MFEIGYNNVETRRRNRAKEPAYGGNPDTTATNEISTMHLSVLILYTSVIIVQLPAVALG